MDSGANDVAESTPSVAERPFIDAVIAAHDPRRRVDRVIASILSAEDTSVRVTVVAHGISAESLTVHSAQFAGDDRLRVVEFTDGLRSPAGPFNHGLSLATGEYVMIIGSDDYLAPGAIDAWADHVRAHNTDYLIAALQNQDGAAWRDPLTRPFRRHSLDAVRDRLNYRAAPLGLIRRSYLTSLEVPLTEGLPTGEDIELGLALLNPQTHLGRNARIDVGATLPPYVIGNDAPERVTFAQRSLRDELEALLLLGGRPWLGQLSAKQRRALAIKLWRLNVIPAVLARADTSDWQQADGEALATVCSWLLALAPDAGNSLSRTEHAIMAAAATGDASTIEQAISRVRAATPAERVLTRSPLHVFDTDSLLRRVARLRLPG